MTEPLTGSVPVPDPTRLTTDAVAAATESWRRELGSVRELIEVRLDAMDLAIKVAAAGLERWPEEAAGARRHMRDEFSQQMLAEREYILSQIKNVSDVAVEKFEAVNTRFLERDTRTEQAAQESRISLDAALAAAKEAVSEQNKANAQAIQKSEVATQKQIDAMVTLMKTSNDSLVDKIDDIKTRLDRGEGSTAGRHTSTTDARANVMAIIMSVSMMIALVSVIAFVLKK